MKLFAVHDNKAQIHLNPLTFRNAGEALRAFETTCKDTNSQFNMYPQDYSLLEIGEYDSDTGSITCYEKSNILANGSDFVQ